MNPYVKSSPWFCNDVKKPACLEPLCSKYFGLYLAGDLFTTLLIESCSYTLKKCNATSGQLDMLTGNWSRLPHAVILNPNDIDFIPFSYDETACTLFYVDGTFEAISKAEYDSFSC